MRFSQVQQYLQSLWTQARAEKRPPATVLLLGPPGIGKSSVAIPLREYMGSGALLEVVDLTSCLPEDLGGLPFREGDTTIYCPQAWMQRLSQPDAKGVLVLDDLPAASPSLAAASRQIALSRSINGRRLGDQVMILVTGNRQKDMSGAMALPSHFRNAVCILEMEPDFEGWTKWFLGQGGDPTIPSFLKWKPNLFSQLPQDADTRGSFATPRTWMMLHQNLPPHTPMAIRMEVSAGFIGEGVTREYLAFQEQMSELPDIKTLLLSPREVMPFPEKVLTTPDRMIGATAGIGQVAAILQKASGDPTAPVVSLLRALHWITRHNREYVALGVNAYSIAGGSNYDLKQASSLLQKEDPEIRAMILDLKEALK